MGISVPETLAISTCALVSLVMLARRDVRLRWGLAMLSCVTMAALISPADLFSTLLTASVMIAAYYAGTRHEMQTRLQA